MRTPSAKPARAGVISELKHGSQRRLSLLSGLEKRLKILNPYQVLSRGYVLSMDENRQVVTSRAMLESGQRLHLLYHDGEADARVETVPDGTT